MNAPVIFRRPMWVAFKRFHRENPHVYRLIERFAHEAYNAGRTNFSISMVVERIRWETAIVTRSDDGFKIPNDHRAYYARLYMAKHDRIGFFRTRKQTQPATKEEYLAL